MTRAIVRSALFGSCALGCAPFASFRPASALMDSEQTVEVGGGVAALSPRPYVEEPTRVTGQLWGTLRANSWLKLTIVSAFDDEAPVGGIEAMAVPFHEYRFAGGVAVSAGYAWADVSLPLAVRPAEPIWIYASPVLRTWSDGKEVFAGIPAGVALRFLPNLEARAEAQVSWTDWKHYNRRWHYGLALVYSF